MTTMNAILFNEEDDLTGLDYFEDTARSIEIVREKTKDGHLGSFGFTLVHQRPPRVGTVVPGVCVLTIKVIARCSELVWLKCLTIYNHFKVCHMIIIFKYIMY